MHRNIQFLFFGLLTYTCLTKAFLGDLFSGKPPILQEQLFTQAKQLVRAALKNPRQSIAFSLGVFITGASAYKFRAQLGSRLNKVYSWSPAVWKTAGTGAFLAATGAVLNKYGLAKSLYKKIKGHEFAAGTGIGIFVAGLLGLVFVADYFKQLQETLQQNQKTMSSCASFLQNVDTCLEVDEHLTKLVHSNHEKEGQEIKQSYDRLHVLLDNKYPDLKKSLEVLIKNHEQCAELAREVRELDSREVNSETKLQQKKAELLDAKAKEIEMADDIRRTLIRRMKIVH